MIDAPVRDLSVDERGPDESEPVSNTIDAAEIEAAAPALVASDLVGQACWSSATSN